LIASPVLRANDLHPTFPLLDDGGLEVVLSGRPMSTMKTCGGCHDTAFIEANSDHADAGASQIGKEKPIHAWAAGPGYFGDWNPLGYDDAMADDGSVDIGAWLRHYGSRHVGGGPVAAKVEMDCLMCHSDITDASARNKALADGDFAWANSARLTERRVLIRDQDGHWRWNAFMFDGQGALNEGLLDIRKPTNDNCAQCHGQVSTDHRKPLVIDPDPSKRSLTNRTGQLISPEMVSQSGLNVAGKDELNHPFDIHAERVVGCVNCHYSLNNPVYFEHPEDKQPEYVRFDPRRLTFSDYLTRPLHQFAKGNSRHGLAAVQSENSLRRCESCHDAARAHQWLPYSARHFASLACESCHVPRLLGPAVQALDWTLVSKDGKALRQYRAVDGEPASADTLIRGFRPVMMARANVGGSRKLAPFNLISSWYWLAGEPARPVPRETLVKALYLNGRLRMELRSLMDDDGNGEVSDSEFRLDTPEKTDAIRKRLSDLGLDKVQLAAEIASYPVSHNVVAGEWATRDCRTCHGEKSVLGAAFVLSDYIPGGVMPVPAPGSPLLRSGDARAHPDGGAAFAPGSKREGFYIIGRDGPPWVDLLGLLMFLGISLGVTVHAVGRYVARRRRGPVTHPTHRIRMYDVYDRLWHWLQAGTILGLLGTGLIIHKPDFFGMFSFAYVVQVHNVLGFILLINAALALFYTLASGTIKRFLPNPDGFVRRAMAQAEFYMRGIFAGEAHPLEKTRDNRLNPLQQITYLAILNILLPAQVITGVLIWGLQRWPGLASAVGGLPFLAPTHTLLAWTFAAFIVMHVYLTTAAGETPLAGIKSMITGWDDVEDEARPASELTEEASHV
jgi:thiosulfate reductase cytochrome b subunit